MTDFWKKMDMAVSVLSAANGGESKGLISWTLTRPLGEDADKEYQVVLRQNNQILELPDSKVHPICQWLSSQGLYPYHRLAAAANEAVRDKIDEGTWEPVLDLENRVMRANWRRPSVRMWNEEHALSNFYWHEVIAGRGLLEHAWVKELHDDLSQEPTPVSRRRVLGHLGKMMAYHPLWEQESGLSLRALGACSEKWQEIMDQSEVGYDARSEGIPLLVLAINPPSGSGPGWLRILSNIKDSHLIETVLQPEDRPDHWWNETVMGPAPMAPLFLWAARRGDAATMELLLADKQDRVNITDSMGNNALHWAAMIGNSDVVKVLLKYGVSTTQENIHGLYPEEVVPEGCDELYEQIANTRLGKPKPSV